MTAAAWLARHLRYLSRAEMVAISDCAGVPRKIGFGARASRKASATAYMLLCSVAGLDAATGTLGRECPPRGHRDLWWVFGAGLFRTRHLRPLDLRSAAGLVGVSAATLSRAERGHTIAIESYLRVVRFIRISPESFLSFTGNTNCNTLKTRDCAAATSGDRR
jgi:hypothetical protein